MRLSFKGSETTWGPFLGGSEFSLPLEMGILVTTNKNHGNFYQKIWVDQPKVGDSEIPTPQKKSPPREKRWAPRVGCWETSLFFGDFTIDFHWFWMSSIGFQDTVDLDFLRSDYDTARVYNRRITIDTGQIRSFFRSLNMTIPQYERTMEASKSPQSEFGTHHLI